MNDAAAFFMFCLGTVTALTTFMWLRESSRRKRIENRLWGMAAAQGLPTPDLLSGDIPLPMSSKGRSVDGGRIEQLESQMDQMAQQMDRLIESQEFLSRVMADRADRLPDPRLRTPH